MASFTRRSQAWLARSVLAILAAIAVLSMPAAPVSAHKDHKAKQEAAQLEAQRAAGGSAQSAPKAHDMAMPGHATAMAAMNEIDDPPKSVAARLLEDWETARGRFSLILPRDYQRVLDVRTAAEAEGLDLDGTEVWDRIMEASRG